MIDYKTVQELQEIETNYLKGLMDINEKYQKYTNWVLIGFISFVMVLTMVSQYKIDKLQETVAIMQCEKDAEKYNAGFYVSDGKCNLIYND